MGLGYAASFEQFHPTDLLAYSQQAEAAGFPPPGSRSHPAVIAQAAATIEAMYPGRFYLGLGAGEALNEHIVGEYWPEAVTRLEILAESIEVIKKLFRGHV